MGARIRSIWRALRRRGDFEFEMSDELQFHVEKRAEDLKRAGESREEAMRRARMEFGAVEKHQDDCREARTVKFFDDMGSDLRFAVRGLARQCTLAITIIATLALGIGLNAGVFTMIDAIAFRPRVAVDPGTFFQAFAAYSEDGAKPQLYAGVTYEDFQAFSTAASVRQLAAWANFAAPLGDNGSSNVRAMLVTCNFLDVYGIQRPLLGRGLEQSDCNSANPVALISSSLWKTQLGSDPGIVGRSIRFNGQPVTVIGVLASPVIGPRNGNDCWLPFTAESYLKLGDDIHQPTRSNWLQLAGRLNPQKSRRDLESELLILAQQQDRLHARRTTSIAVSNGSINENPNNNGLISWVVALLVAPLYLITLLACANVSTLMLSRAHARQHEIALRLALGAGRVRLLRMLLTETVLLAVMGATASVYLIFRVPVALDKYLSLYPGMLILAPDWKVLFYLACLTLFAGVASGLSPAWESGRVDLTDALKSRGSIASGTPRTSRVRGALIAVQVAISFVLVAGSSIVIRTYQFVAAADPGVDAQHVVATVFNVRAGGVAQSSALQREAEAKLRSLPGAQSVAFTSSPPIGPTTFKMEVRADGGSLRHVDTSAISPHYFATVSTPLISGRDFQDSDPPCGAQTCQAVVSEPLAREFWGNSNPLGQVLRTAQGRSLQVIGVCKDTQIKYLGISDGPLVYTLWAPATQVYSPLVRFAGNAQSMSSVVGNTLREISPGALVNADTIEQYRSQALDAFGELKVLCSILGVIGLGLAVVGVYGVVSFSVTQRMKEMGIRMALGAGKREIYTSVMRTSSRSITVGLVIGLGVVFLLGNFMNRLVNLVFPLRTRDPLALLSALLVLVAAAITAVMIPARRAASCDPLRVLREE